MKKAQVGDTVWSLRPFSALDKWQWVVLPVGTPGVLVGVDPVNDYFHIRWPCGYTGWEPSQCLTTDPKKAASLILAA